MRTTQIEIKKSVGLKGAFISPPSKSHTLRAVIFATIARGISIIKNPLLSADVRSCIAACRKIGAEIKILKSPARLLIRGTAGDLEVPKSVVDVGNSGITLRFIGALAANCRKEVLITGDRSARNRPMQPMIDALKRLGVKIEAAKNNGFAPLAIRGPMSGNRTVVSGEDSQFVSGLLITGLLARRGILVDVLNPGEKPWVGMTLWWLDKLGLKYKNKNFSHYKIFGNQEIKNFQMTIPGDFSSAAYPMVATLISRNSQITIEGLDRKDVQGDKKIIDILRRAGGRIFWSGDDLIVQSSLLEGIEIDANDFIDAVPILAVAGCYAKGFTKIKNVAVARTKECNRLAAITEELSKMGADIRETTDGLEIRNSALRGVIVDSRGDHRMVFSLAVAALGAFGITKIVNAGCVSKTMPNFVKLMRNIGVRIKDEKRKN
jgi:3-phosphoshikimate 1-carboxyvinyltransferase